MLTEVKCKNQVFRLARYGGDVVVLPHSVLQELSMLPADVASPHGALEHDLLGQYTGLNLILESRMHHTIVQRKLTPRLGILSAGLEQELNLTLDDCLEPCEDWTPFVPYQLFGKISARLSARAMVGPELCRNSTWLDISINYTESCESHWHVDRCTSSC